MLMHHRLHYESSHFEETSCEKSSTADDPRD